MLVNGDIMTTCDLLAWFKEMYDHSFAKQKCNPQAGFVKPEVVSLKSSREFETSKCLRFVFTINSVKFILI